MNIHPLTPTTYEEFPPAGNLRSWVAYYWRYRVGAVAGTETGVPGDVIKHSIPPEVGLTLTLLPLNIPSPTSESSSAEGFPLLLSGPQRKAIEVQTAPGSTICGVRFWPGTCGSLLIGGAEDIVDTIVPAIAALPRVAIALAERANSLARARDGEMATLAEVFSESLGPLVPDRSDMDAAVLDSVFCLLDPSSKIDVNTLASRHGLSARQLRRRFKRAVGMTIRDFRTTRRLRLTLERAVSERSTPWVDVAGENGYSDQAHLCREMQRLTGRSPRQYRKHIDHIDHLLMNEQAKA